MPEKNDIPIIDPRIEYVGATKLRSLNTTNLSKLKKTLVIQDNDTPLAVLLNYEQYLTIQRKLQEAFHAGNWYQYLIPAAEALAEYLHKKMREELGIAGEDSPHIRDLFHQKYRGSRYSFGYPACPNLEDQTKLFVLLHPEENVGVRLTSGFLLDPEQSTSAIVVHHPSAKYFVV